MDEIYATLKDVPAENKIDSVVRTALAIRFPQARFPVYNQILRVALAEQPPPFSHQDYADTFRNAAENGHWLAISLMTNAEREGDGATRLWSMAACCPDERERKLLKRHAVDESGHAMAYLSLLDLCFPGAVSDSFRAELKTLSPGYTMNLEPEIVRGSPYAHQPTVDDYIQMNIAEIRTSIHHLMQRAAIAKHCPIANAPKINHIMETLLQDELGHVAYTAELIDEKAAGIDPDALQNLFSKRVNDFNQITLNELGCRVFD
jgi:hypothetical protein